MKFITKSLNPDVTHEELAHQGVKTTSFLSFERAIEETNRLAGVTDKVRGYEVTDQGINIIWE